MKRLLLIVILCLCVALPARAAIAATMQWDVRTGGVDTNGGGFDASAAIPGQDFSQQNAAQVAFTDLVIGATTTHLTSALNPFATCTAGVGYCGNVINITGGAGCTVGWYEILSTSTITATMDRSVGTAASTCTGNLGGSLLTLAKAMALTTVANMTIHQKSGTYTTSATQTFPAVSFSWHGYGSTHLDGGAKPLNKNTNGSANNFSNGTTDIVAWIDNVEINQSAGTGFAGIANQSHAFYLTVTNSKFSGNMSALFGSAANQGAFRSLLCENDEFSATNTAVTSDCGGIFRYCYFHGCAGDFTDTTSAAIPQLLYFEGCVFTGSTTNSISLNKLSLMLRHSAFYGITSNNQAIWMPNANLQYIWVEDSVFYNISGGGNAACFRLNSATPILVNRANAFDSSTLNFSTPGWTKSSTDVTLTADPFTAGGSADFSLNSTAGGGALLKNQGLPLTTAEGNNYIDIGPLRHQDPAGGGGTRGYTFSRNKLPEGVLRIW